MCDECRERLDGLSGALDAERSAREAAEKDVEVALAFAATFVNPARIAVGMKPLDGRGMWHLVLRVADHR